jgi:hypothetical protein
MPNTGGTGGGIACKPLFAQAYISDSYLTVFFSVMIFRTSK